MQKTRGTDIAPSHSGASPYTGSANQTMSTFNSLAMWLRARFGTDENGASIIEYALLVALIAVVCLLAVQVLGSTTSESLSTTASHVAGSN